MNGVSEGIDPELLSAFVQESSEVILRLTGFLEKFTKTSENSHFESFGQEIDRIMGTAYTLSLKEIGDLAKQGKEIGYKASQLNDLSKLLSVQSLLSQLVKTLESMIKSLKRKERTNSSDSASLLKRLTLANTQLGDLRVTVKS